MKIIIPGRMGSKGLPFKNRTLFKYTANIIPPEKKSDTWVTTDDPEIASMTREWGFNLIERPSELASDTTSVRDTMVHAINSAKIRRDLIVVLYLTYPERTWEDVRNAMDFFLQYYQDKLTDSLLCKKEVKSHPYLCLQEHGVDGIFGKQLVSHDLYRRQDYPRCFELSHFVSIFDSAAIYKLNSNLYCDTTVFYEIPEVVDVDTQKDLDALT